VRQAPAVLIIQVVIKEAVAALLILVLQVRATEVAAVAEAEVVALLTQDRAVAQGLQVAPAVGVDVHQEVAHLLLVVVKMYCPLNIEIT